MTTNDRVEAGVTAQRLMQHAKQLRDAIAAGRGITAYDLAECQKCCMKLQDMLLEQHHIHEAQP